MRPRRSNASRIIDTAVKSPATAASAAACAPTSSTSGAYTVESFTSTGNCDWTVPTGVSSIQTLVVGGGGSGGGGKSSVFYGQGGGGGAVVEKNFTVNAGATIAISVGAGGDSPNYNTASTSANNGRSSSVVVSVSDSATAPGGFSPVWTSGVGGVSGTNKAGGTGAGGTYGNGGGGAGAAGSGSTGGAGISSSITGTSVEYGGGGGGYNGGTAIGTATGGGATYNTPALANRGGGGANGGPSAFNGLPGGSGVVIIRYTTPIPPVTVTYNENGGDAAAPSSQSQSTSGEILNFATYSGLKNGNRFISWNTAADGSGTYYKAGRGYAPSTDLTLYAQWMDAYCPEGWTWTEPTCSKTFSGVKNFIIPWGFKSLDVIAVGGSGANGAKGVVFLKAMT